MSTYVECFAEARIKGKDGWTNIDMFAKREKNGSFYIVPLIDGTSSVASALHWDGRSYPIDKKTLSPELVKELTYYKNYHTKTDADGKEYEYISYSGQPESGCKRFETGFPEDWQFQAIDGRDLANRDFDIPELVGYVSKQLYNEWKSDPNSVDLVDEDFMTPDDFIKLPPEAQKGFTYVEYTEPYGTRWVLKWLKDSLLSRIRAYNEHSRDWKNNSEISLSDCRVVVYTS